jgi:hypothetical protein
MKNYIIAILLFLQAATLIKCSVADVEPCSDGQIYLETDKVCVSQLMAWRTITRFRD